MRADFVEMRRNEGVAGVPRTGIVVDTHVRRVAGRLGWAGGACESKALGIGDGGATAEDTRKELEVWVPIDARVEFTLALIAHGQTVCTKERPLCAECAAQAKCPSAFKFTAGSNKTKTAFFGAAPARHAEGAASARNRLKERVTDGGCADASSPVIVLDDDEEVTCDKKDAVDMQCQMQDIEDVALPFRAMQPPRPPFPPPSAPPPPPQQQGANPELTTASRSESVIAGGSCFHHRYGGGSAHQ